VELVTHQHRWDYYCWRNG